MTPFPNDIRFLPIIYRLAARLEQLTWEELAEDATSATFAMRSAQQLFGLRAVVSHYRLGFEAEACGADLGRDALGNVTGTPAPAASIPSDDEFLSCPPLAQALEITSRLSAEFRDDVAVAGVLTGPRTLGAVFSTEADDVAQLYAVLARAYLERGARLLLVAEEPVLAAGAGAGASLTRLLNVAAYFGAPVIVLDELAPEQVLPVDLLARDPDRSWRQERVVVTGGEVPQDLPAEHLTAWIKELS